MALVFHFVENNAPAAGFAPYQEGGPAGPA